MTRQFLIAAFVASMTVFPAMAQSGFSAALAGDGWDGRKIPAGEQCRLFGGNGSTPGFKVTGIPAGTDRIEVEFNDLSFGPLSRDGGHGVIAWAHKSGTSATLRPVPGYTRDLPAGVTLVSAARSEGRFASLGYLPPCSGGQGNSYEAKVKAMKGREVLATANVPLGRY